MIEIPKIVNINDTEYDVYIGRPSKWKNPYKIGKDGTRSEVIEKYRQYLLHNNKLYDSLDELGGKVMACHCKPLPCHGDVIIELIKRKNINSLADY